MTEPTDIAALAAAGLSAGYDHAPILHDLSLQIPRGRITALIGPNGSGKSTLLKALARILQPDSGALLLDGAPLAGFGARDLARRMSLLPQGPLTPEGITVRDLVAYGRYPHQGPFSRMSAADHAAIARAIQLTGLADLAGRPVEALSGGQRQRAWIAMIAAQDAGIMLLDEPTTFLDIAHQIEVLALLSRLNRELGRTIVMVLHDLNLAARHADLIIALKAGRILASGPPEAVMTPDTIAEVFGLAVAIFADPATGRPWCIPAPLTDGVTA